MDDVVNHFTLRQSDVTVSAKNVNKKIKIITEENRKAKQKRQSKYFRQGLLCNL